MYRVLRQNRKTDFLRYIIFFVVGGVKHFSSFPSSPLPFKILVIDITQKVGCYLQTVTTRKFLPFKPSDVVNIPFETHP